MILRAGFRISRYKVLAWAIAISLGWHLFWIAAIKVVAAPQVGGPIKFSRVSFLGPILSKNTGVLKATASGHSFLERRYLNFVNAPPQTVAEVRAAKYEDGSVLGARSDEEMKSSIENALAGGAVAPPASDEGP